MAWENDKVRFQAGRQTFDRWAARYDELVPRTAAAERALNALAEIAPGKRVLELAVGTGRMAIPLAERGFDVTGLDSSLAMLDRLSENDGAGRVTAVEGDMRDFDLGSDFDLIFLVLNGFYLLPDQAAQLECLRCCARHLAPDGLLVIEGFVPPSRDAFPFGQLVGTTFLATDPPEVRLECSLHDPVDQTVRTQIVSLTKGDIEMFPLRLRYVSPAELDLMAGIAGLRPIARHGDWQGTALAPKHSNCISVFGKQPGRRVDQDEE
jgi:SAM-dependent methyltransferase